MEGEGVADFYYEMLCNLWRENLLKLDDASGSVDDACSCLLQPYQSPATLVVSELATGELDRAGGVCKQAER